MSTGSRKGRFITLEGIEGAGKSTQVAPLMEELARCGIDALATREPGGTPEAEAIRSLLLDPANRSLGKDAEVLLVFAARAEHLEKVVRPALERGTWVVSDRFTDATFAYQGAGREVASQRIAVLEEWVQRDLRPDLTFVLDLPVSEGQARIRGRQADRFEREDNSFFERIRAAYLERARTAPERYRIVDASASPALTSTSIRRAISHLIE